MNAADFKKLADELFALEAACPACQAAAAARATYDARKDPLANLRAFKPKKVSGSNRLGICGTHQRARLNMGIRRLKPGLDRRGAVRYSGAMVLVPGTPEFMVAWTAVQQFLDNQVERDPGENPSPEEATAQRLVEQMDAAFVAVTEAA